MSRISTKERHHGVEWDHPRIIDGIVLSPSIEGRCTLGEIQLLTSNNFRILSLSIVFPPSFRVKCYHEYMLGSCNDGKN